MTSHVSSSWVRHAVRAFVQFANVLITFGDFYYIYGVQAFIPGGGIDPRAQWAGIQQPPQTPPPPRLLSPQAASGAESWPVECMQQNGSSASNGSGGCGRERQSPSFSPLPAATTRVRRFIQERRTLPLPRVMVVFSGAGDGDKPGDAMSGSEPAEDDPRQPASPSPNRTPSKPPRSSLNSQEQEVGRRAGNMCFLSNKAENTTEPTFMKSNERLLKRDLIWFTVETHKPQTPLGINYLCSESFNWYL